MASILVEPLQDNTLGVRGGGLHTHDEWIDLSSLVERAQLLAVLLRRLSDRG